MSFVAEFNSLPLESLVSKSRSASSAVVRESLAKSSLTLADFASLISPAAGASLETMGRRSQALTQRRFGKVIRLFAPLYLSNECINNCKYCGFSRDNPILRVTFGRRNLARGASAGNAVFQTSCSWRRTSKSVSNNYLRDCVAALHEETPSVSLEVGPMEREDYGPLVMAGADGLVVYQETYDRAIYQEMHTAGPKRNFDWRLETPERAYAAGFRRIGIGALYGLADWRFEALAVAAHVDYLLHNCWKASLTISLPRLRPSAGEFEPLTQIGDRELVQLVCAFRLMFPDAGLVLSTRESAQLRDGLIPLGITLMSAGSHTEPGGYTGAGKANLHRTERGRMVFSSSSSVNVKENSFGSSEPDAVATEQFTIADTRSPMEIAHSVRHLGYGPVWKDWESVLTATSRDPIGPSDRINRHRQREAD